MQVSTDRQVNEIRKIICEQIQKFNKVSAIKKNQTEIMELKNTVTELKIQ